MTNNDYLLFTIAVGQAGWSRTVTIQVNNHLKEQLLTKISSYFHKKFFSLLVFNISQGFVAYFLITV